MSKTIVLEPFSDWRMTLGGEPYLVRESDRHEIRIEFRGESAYVHLHHLDDTVRTLNSGHVSALADLVQFVDRYVDLHYQSAVLASRQIETLISNIETLQKQINQLRASAVGQA